MSCASLPLAVKHCFKNSCSFVVLCICNRLLVFFFVNCHWRCCAALAGCLLQARSCVSCFFSTLSCSGGQDSYKGTCGVHCWPSCIYLLVCVSTLNTVTWMQIKFCMFRDLKKTSLLPCGWGQWVGIIRICPKWQFKTSWSFKSWQVHQIQTCTGQWSNFT